MPKVSFLMSVYNDGKYLNDCINSILSQSFDDFELIIVNDGSTDDSSEIIRSFDDDRIKIFDKDNSGLTSSLNYGLKYCQGDWIARIDGDDICEVDRLFYQLQYAESGVAVIGSRARLIDGNGKYIDSNTEVPLTHAKILKSILNSKLSLSHPATLINKKLMLEVGGYDERFIVAQDVDLWLRLSKVGMLLNVDKELIKLRKHGDNISQKKFEEQTLNGLLSRAIYYKTIDSKGNFKINDEDFLKMKSKCITLMTKFKLMRFREAHIEILNSIKEKCYFRLIKVLFNQPYLIFIPLRKVVWGYILNRVKS